MVFSTVGFFFSGGSGTSIRYNGQKISAVVSEQGLIQGYVTEIDDEQVYFLSTPEDTLSIPLPTGFIETLQNAEAIVFLFDPHDNSSGFYDQLRYDFSTTIPKQQVALLTEAHASYPMLSVGDCSAAAPVYPVIELRQGPRAVEYEDGCFVMQASEPYDFALLRDRIVYAYYGITEN